MHALGGGRSCSAYGYRAIARGGLRKGLVLLRRRFAHCARANARRAAPRLGPGLAHQRGFCDIPDCGGCDLPDCGGCDLPDTGICDLLSGCADCGCDWPWRRQQTVRPKLNQNDFLNNETALRARVRQAQARNGAPGSAGDADR